jgi:hypothetical protein
MRWGAFRPNQTKTPSILCKAAYHGTGAWLGIAE